MAESYGWKIDYPEKVDWKQLRNNVQDHIKSINFGYKKSMREISVDYVNAKATLGEQLSDGAHTVEFELKG